MCARHSRNILIAFLASHSSQKQAHSKERVCELTKHTLALQLVVSWPGAYGGQSGGACTGNITWPALDSIVLLGTAAGANGITMQVRSLGMTAYNLRLRSESRMSGR